MKKRLFALLLLLSLLMSTVGAEAEAMLYMVTDAQGHTLYLLPSIHIGDDEVEHALDGLILDTLAGADRLAAETDLNAYFMDLKQTSAVLLMLRYAGGDTPAKHLKKETLQSARALLKAAKLYRTDYEVYRPGALMALCETAIGAQCAYTGQQGVDLIMLKKAKEFGLPIDSLETVQEQYDVLLSISDELADYYISYYAQNQDAAQQALYQSVQAWLSGDEETLMALNLPDIEALPQALRRDAERYWNAMLSQRNARFEQKAQAYLESGETVCMMLGATHILGKDGLAQRLTDLGYTVDQIQ